MTPAELSTAIIAAVRGAVADGEMVAVPVPSSVSLRPTRNGAGYATPLPLRLSAATGRTPGEVATILAKRLGRVAGVRTVRVTGPGVLTVSLRAPGALAAAIVDAGMAYGAAPVPPPSAPLWPRRPLTFDNPGFLVRFAHVRATATARYAGALGIVRGPLVPELLDDAREHALLGLLGEYPQRTALAARTRDPGILARHLERAADAYHDVHEHCPALPGGDEPPTDRQHARLWLAAAVTLVMAGGLRMLGELPPERL